MSKASGPRIAIRYCTQCHWLLRAAATPSPREARWRLSGLVRCPFRAECPEANDAPPAALSGGVETDSEGFIRPSYNATGGASKAMRRGNVTVGTPTRHSHCLSFTSH
jgi:hypothetical protein